MLSLWHRTRGRAKGGCIVELSRICPQAKIILTNLKIINNPAAYSNLNTTILSRLFERMNNNLLDCIFLNDFCFFFFSLFFSLFGCTNINCTEATSAEKNREFSFGSGNIFFCSVEGRCLSRGHALTTISSLIIIFSSRERQILVSVIIFGL